MSGGCDLLQLKADDVQKMLAAHTHTGSGNLDFQMAPYVFTKRKEDGTHIFNVKWTWEKLLMAARAIVAIENPADVVCISGKNYGQRAVLKFSKYTGATPIAGRLTPGTFTNHMQKNYREPRLLVVTDPRVDHQAVTEASYGNIPVIAFCDTDAPLRSIDIAIPCNNKSIHSIGLMWWMLAREVLRMRGATDRTKPWEVMVDLFFYRDPEEAEKEEREREAANAAANAQLPGEPVADMYETAGIGGIPQADFLAAGGVPAAENWDAAAQPAAFVPPAAAAPAAAAGGAEEPGHWVLAGEWAAQVPTAAPGAPEWGGPEAEHW